MPRQAFFSNGGPRLRVCLARWITKEKRHSNPVIRSFIAFFGWPFFIQGLCRNVSFDAAPFRCVLTCLPDCIFMDYKYKLVISGFSLFYMVEKLLGSYSCTFSSLGIARTCSVLLSAYRKRSSKCTFSRLGIARTPFGSALGLSKTFIRMHLFSPQHSPNKFGFALGYRKRSF